MVCASITQCTTTEFLLFLQRWNSLIESYNLDYFNIYHMVRCVCVLENFNCMLLGGWTLIGTRTVIPHDLNAFRIAFYFATQ